DVGVDRGERVVGGQRAGPGQCVEQRRLADVGQADDADGQAHLASLGRTGGPADRCPGPRVRREMSRRAASMEIWTRLRCLPGWSWASCWAARSATCWPAAGWLRTRPA